MVSTGLNGSDGGASWPLIGSLFSGGPGLLFEF